MGRVVKRPRATGMASIRLVWPFIELARKNGFARELDRFHELLGLTREELNDPDTRVPQQRIADLLSLAIARTGYRDIGLLAARCVDGSQAGIGEFLARSRATLREALESGVQYTALAGDGAQRSFHVEGKLAISRVSFDPKLVIHEAAYEFVMALGILRARRLTGIDDLAPVEVHFTHRQPADVRRHEKLFRCPVRFSMPFTQLVMSASALEVRLATAEPELSRLLERQANAMLERLPRTDSVTARTRALLGAERHLRVASAEHIAGRLGMSVRTLSRKLREEGSSFRALIDEARAAVALRDLTLSARSIGEIADQLGFSSGPSFHRAFKRWTGKTAAQYRADAQSKAQSA